MKTHNNETCATTLKHPDLKTEDGKFDQKKVLAKLKEIERSIGAVETMEGGGKKNSFE